MKSLFAIAVVMVSLGSAAHADGIRRMGQPGSKPQPVNLTRSIFPDTKAPIRPQNRLEKGSAPPSSKPSVKPGFMRPRAVQQAPVQRPGMAPGQSMVDKIRRR